MIDFTITRHYRNADSGSGNGTPMYISALKDGYRAIQHTSIHIYLLVKAQVPMSIFLAGSEGEMSKSKMSIGSPSVMQALGI